MQFNGRMVMMMNVREKTIIALAFLVLTLFFTGRVQAVQQGPTFICGVDLNNNGTTSDKGELEQCWLTVENTYLCPIQVAGCTASYVPVICPGGGTLNTVTDQCELPGGALCSNGYVYDAPNDICTAPPDCSGGTLDTITDICYQDVLCPQNFHFAYDACVKTPTCPPGGTYDGAYDRCSAAVIVSCPVGYAYDSYLFPDNCKGPYACAYDNGTPFTPTKLQTGEYICALASSDSCPAGYTFEVLYNPAINQFEQVCTANKQCLDGVFNSVTGKCEVAVTVNIPQGYVWDPGMGAYLGDPSCPLGTTYNTATDICEGPPDLFSCPAGFVANAANTGCEMAKCPNGTWISDGVTYEKCQASPVAINCPAGFSYANGYCTQAPACDPSSTFDAGSHKCIYNSQLGCSPGYTYNSVTGRCESPPVCTGNDVYDPVIDRCVAPNPAAQSCPLGNFPCDPATGQCVNSYPCSTTFQTFAICSQNCDGTCTSACGTDALAAFGDVYWIGQTPTSWFGITGVTGSGSDLVFYGKDANANYASIEVGRVTMNGCTFSGSASYFTSGPDNCSSTAWGLSGLQATGNQMTFYGGECGQASGTINVSGCYISVPQSSGNFDLTHVIGSGTSLNFYSGYGGNQPIVSLGLCQYSWTCPTCSKTANCSYTCPDPSYALTADYRCSKFATCTYGGTLSTSLDVCEEVVAVNCPTGYTAVGTQCQADPACPQGSTFDPSLNLCVTTTGINCPQRSLIYFATNYVYDPAQSSCFADISCPAGSSTGTPFTSNVCTAPFSSAVCPAQLTYNSVTGKCEASPSGMGTLDTALDKYVYYAVETCPMGWINNGNGLCQGDKQCPDPGVWDATTYKTPQLWAAPRCVAQTMHLCPNGYAFNQYVDQFGYTQSGCTRANNCQPGDLVKRAFYYYCVDSNPPTKTCPPNYAYDSTVNACVSSAICEVGTLDTTINYCVLTSADICPFGYTLNVSLARCETAPSCSQPGTYSASMDLCTMPAVYTCPAGYAYLNGTCYSVPNCPNGTYDPVNKSCYTGLDTCTIGNYPCYTYNGRRLCSQYTCVDQTNPIVVDTGASTIINPVNDGTVDQNGNCSGQFYILSGEAGECRTVGTQTIFHNCCNSTTAMNPLYCDPAVDGKVASKAVQNLCHYIGTYCAETWAVIGCVQSKKVYCCFNSILGRIINEQGRTQLQSFQPDPWGTVMNPKCRGFTPEEFQMLDFSRIDLSEFFTLIQTTATTDVQNSATQKIQNFYQNVQ